MKWSYDKALALFRSWEQAKDKPTLVIELGISSLAYMYALCEVFTVSEESASVAFGREAWGNGQITLPLRNTDFTYLQPTDKPLAIRPQGDEYVVGWLDMKFAANDDGCRITEFKRGGFITVGGVERCVINILPAK